MHPHGQPPHDQAPPPPPYRQAPPPPPYGQQGVAPHGYGHPAYPSTGNGQPGLALPRNGVPANWPGRDVPQPRSAGRAVLWTVLSSWPVPFLTVMAGAGDQVVAWLLAVLLTAVTLGMVLAIEEWEQDLIDVLLLRDLGAAVERVVPAAFAGWLAALVGALVMLHLLRRSARFASWYPVLQAWTVCSLALPLGVVVALIVAN